MMLHTQMLEDIIAILGVVLAYINLGAKLDQT
jgi:hypothetical protein